MHGSCPLTAVPLSTVCAPWHLWGGVRCHRCPFRSFIGHFSGIIAGLLVGWGLFSWITPYWFVSSLLYLLLFLAVSVKTTTNVSVPCVTIPQGGGAYVP